MSYRSPWAAIAEFAQGFAPILDQTVQRFQQQSAYNGQQAQTQVQEYVSQAETALADPNYQWAPGQREAAEAFITQAKNITRADPTQAAGMWADLQKRGIKIPSTAIKQGAAGEGMTEEETLTPYEGGISGFFGDVNSGVAKAGQEQAEYEKDLELARELQLNGQTQAYQTQRDAMLDKYGRDNMRLQADLGAEATQTQLDANASWQRATSFAEQLRNIGDISDPKNAAAAARVMTNARTAGLLPGDLQMVQGEREALGSATAALGWQEALEARHQGQLTTEDMQQRLELGKRQITIADQTITLGEYDMEDREYITNRRTVEDAVNDRVTWQDYFGSIVANGDDKEINNLLNILDAGGTVSPDIYEALTSAGYTSEVLEEKLGDAIRSDEFIARKDQLDIAETTAAFEKLRNELDMDAVELANAQSVFLEGVSSRMSPQEIAAAAADPKTQLGRLVADGLISDADLRAANRNAGFHMVLRTEELNAPAIERKMNLLETFAAVPSDPEASLNSLTGTLNSLVDLGAIDEGDVQGIVSQYQRAWDVGAREQDAGIASTIAQTAYTDALRAVQVKSLTAAAAEPGAWGDEQKEQVAAINASHDATREDIKEQHSQCFDSASGMAGTPQCQTAIALVEENRLNRIERLQTVMGPLAPEDREATLLNLAAGVQNEVLQDPTFADADPARIEHEVDRRMFEITGEGDPGPWVEPSTAARQGRPSTGSLMGDFGAGAREVGGTIRQQVGEIVGGANAVERYVLGGNSGTAAAAPATPAPRTQPSAAPAPQGPPPALANSPSFKELVEGIRSGGMNTTMQRAMASTMADNSELGMTTSDVLEWAEAMTRDGTETDGFIAPWSR